jgi:hypothetical protein
MANIEDVYRKLLELQQELVQITTVGLIEQAKEVKQDVIINELQNPTDFIYQISAGERDGYIPWNKFGYNSDISAANQEVIWSHSNGWSFLTTPSTLEIVSTSSNDTLLGTGARTVNISGINQNKEIVSEDVELDGINPVTTQHQYFGVNRIAVTLSGSLNDNDGIITAAVTGSPTNIQAEIPVGAGITQQAIFFIPAGYMYQANWLWANVARTGGNQIPTVTIYMYHYSYLTNTKREVFRAKIDGSVANSVDVTPPQPFVVPEQGVMWVEAKTDKDSTEVQVRFSGILKSNLI